MGAGASISSSNGLQEQDVIDQLNARGLNYLNTIIRQYWKAQTPHTIGRGKHAKVIEPKIPCIADRRRLTMFHINRIKEVTRKLDRAQMGLAQGKAFMEDKIESFERQLATYHKELMKSFPPYHSIDGSIDSEAAAGALEAACGEINADALETVLQLVVQISGGPRRFQFEKVLARAASGEAAVADFSYMCLTDDQLQRVVEAIVISPSSRGIFKLLLNGNHAITSAGVMRSISKFLLPSIIGSPRAKRLLLIDLEGLSLVGDQAGLAETFPLNSPIPLQINIKGTSVSPSKRLVNEEGKKLRERAQLMCILSEKAAEIPELYLYVALSGY